MIPSTFTSMKYSVFCETRIHLLMLLKNGAIEGGAFRIFQHLLLQSTKKNWKEALRRNWKFFEKKSHNAKITERGMLLFEELFLWNDWIKFDNDKTVFIQWEE